MTECDDGWAERDRLRAVAEAARMCREDEAPHMIYEYGAPDGNPCAVCNACGEHLDERGIGHQGCWWLALTDALGALDGDADG